MNQLILDSIKPFATAVQIERGSILGVEHERADVLWELLSHIAMAYPKEYAEAFNMTVDAVITKFGTREMVIFDGPLVPDNFTLVGSDNFTLVDSVPTIPSGFTLVAPNVVSRNSMEANMQGRIFDDGVVEVATPERFIETGDAIDTTVDHGKPNEGDDGVTDKDSTKSDQ